MIIHTRHGILRTLIRPFCLLLTVALLCTGLLGCGTNSENDPASSGDGTRSADIPVGGDPDAAPTGKRVALTFDDGPHNVRTREIVDELSRYGYSATFFVVGNRVDGSAYNGGATLSYIVNAGNELGIHGYTHEVYYNSCEESVYQYELSQTAKVIRDQIPNYDIRLMRPIGGAISQERLEACPYSVVMWSVDSEDWRYKYSSGDTDEEAAQKVDQIVENVMSSVEDGDIILMHDIYESTYDAVKIILQRLHAEGYDVVTVSELLGGNPAPGVRYSQAAK